MPVYDHNLAFGILLDPVLEPANHAVELVTLSESLDYDLASHPLSVPRCSEPIRREITGCWMQWTQC